MKHFHILTYFDIFWWIVIFYTWLWPKSQSLTFQCTFDWKSTINQLILRDILSHAISSKLCNWIPEIMFPTNQPFARSKNQKMHFLSQNPNFDHFALLMTWMLFLRNCDHPLINWWIWFQNVDVFQKSWSLIVG